MPDDQPNVPPTPEQPAVAVNPLDALFAAEEAALTTPPPQSIEAAPEPPPPPTTPQPEPAPIQEPPPAAPVEPQQVAPPAEPPPAETKPPGEPSEAWKRAREAERRADEARRELLAERERIAAIERRAAELEAQMRHAQQPPETVEEPDEWTKVNNRLAALEAKLQQEQYAKTIDETLNTQARDFARDHTDYQQALEYYVQQEREAAEASGELDVLADRIRQQVPEQIRADAEQRRLTQDEVARELAVRVLFEARKQSLVVGAQRRGRSVPEIIYERAQKWGFKGTNGNGNGAPETRAAPTLPASASAAEQVRQEQARAGASSLSTLDSRTTPPPRQIRTMNDFLSLSAEEQERYTAEMDERARRGEVSVTWDQELIR